MTDYNPWADEKPFLEPYRLPPFVPASNESTSFHVPDIPSPVEPAFRQIDVVTVSFAENASKFNPRFMINVNHSCSSVPRSKQDFVMLDKYLQHRHKFRIIPRSPLGSLTIFRKNSSTIKSLQRYISLLLAHPIVRHDDNLLSFVGKESTITPQEEEIEKDFDSNFCELKTEIPAVVKHFLNVRKNLAEKSLLFQKSAVNNAEFAHLISLNPWFCAEGPCGDCFIVKNKLHVFSTFFSSIQESQQDHVSQLDLFLSDVDAILEQAKVLQQIVKDYNRLCQQIKNAKTPTEEQFKLQKNAKNWILQEMQYWHTNQLHFLECVKKYTRKMNSYAEDLLETTKGMYESIK